MTVSTDRLLRRTLWGNAVFSILSGAVMVVDAAPLARFVTETPLAVGGVDLATVFVILGIGVFVFGALCAWSASRPALPRALARVILAADIAWVAGSALALLSPASWSTAGFVGIAVVALIVADIAVLEYLGLRRLRAAG